MMRLPLSTVAAVLLLTACSQAPTEAQIKDAILAANYCETPDDCVDVGGKCPFDCYIFVNMNEEERIKAMVDGYDSDCTYSCLAINGVDCVENTCQPILTPPERVSADDTGNPGTACTAHEDCHTPMEYLMRSSCPFTSMCIEGSCSVICPMTFHDPNPVISKSYPVSCEENADCTCSEYAAAADMNCACVDSMCVAVVK